MWYVLRKEKVNEISCKFIENIITEEEKLNEYIGFEDFLETEITYTIKFKGTKEECERMIYGVKKRKMEDVQLKDINEILKNTELFWRYICGCSCQFCKNKDKILYMPKPTQDLENRISGIEDAPSQKGKGKVSSDKMAQLAALKAKLKGEKTDKPSQTFSCEKCKEHPKELMNEEIVKIAMKESESILKETFDIWKKQGYNIHGFMELSGDRIGLEFRKTYEGISEIVRFSPNNEQIWGIVRKEGTNDSPKVFLSVELLSLEKMIKYFNEDANNYFKKL